MYAAKRAAAINLRERQAAHHESERAFKAAELALAAADSAQEKHEACLARQKLERDSRAASFAAAAAAAAIVASAASASQDRHSLRSKDGKFVGSPANTATSVARTPGLPSGPPLKRARPPPRAVGSLRQQTRPGVSSSR